MIAEQLDSWTAEMGGRRVTASNEAVVLAVFLATELIGTALALLGRDITSSLSIR